MIFAAVRNAVMKAMATDHAQAPAKRSVTLTPNERLRIQRSVLDAMLPRQSRIGTRSLTQNPLGRV